MFSLNTSNIVFSIGFIMLVSCASKGTPSGGAKDESPPILLSDHPNNKSINFENKKKIKLVFNEYIKIEDSKNIVISPLLKNKATFYPQGFPSKFITIDINDTLLENTTYTIDFGNSIIDNNEGNIFSDYQYVFSTGDQIDSLLSFGTIKNAYSHKKAKNISVMLYEINDAYNDSTIFKENPKYIANTLDSTIFTLRNIKAGTYKMIAINDKSNDNKYNPKTDQIGFLDGFLKIPSDSISHSLALFNEIPNFESFQPTELSKGHILLPYIGNGEKTKISIKTKKTNNEYTVQYNDKTSDSIHFWYNDTNIRDSIILEINNKNYSKDYRVILRAKDIDTLSISSNANRDMSPLDSIFIKTNTPIHKINTSLIHIIDKDSNTVSYKDSLSISQNELRLAFKKKENEVYTIQLLPNAIKDIFNTSNDSIEYIAKINSLEKYGNLFLSLKKEKNYPLIVDLLNDKKQQIRQYYLEKEEEINFIGIKSGKYSVRIIYDSNKNKKWDTGNFLKNIQPEKVIYDKNIFDIRENFDSKEFINVN